MLQGFTQIDLPLPEDSTDSARHLKESYLDIEVQRDDVTFNLNNEKKWYLLSLLCFIWILSEGIIKTCGLKVAFQGQQSAQFSGVWEGDCKTVEGYPKLTLKISQVD